MMSSPRSVDGLQSVIKGSTAVLVPLPPPGPRYGNNSVGSPKLSPPSNCNSNDNTVVVVTVFSSDRRDLYSLSNDKLYSPSVVDKQ